MKKSDIQIIIKYFPHLTPEQTEQFSIIGELYRVWNEKINVISRKDIDNIYVHHVLHSLAISKIVDFTPGSIVLDVGTGGGFPGIPLAILYPDVKFLLIDSIKKKIKVVNEVTARLELNNVEGRQQRVQKITDRFDFIISRAVTAFPKFVNMVRKNISLTHKNAIPNGILYLKGGIFEDEISQYKKSIEVFDLSSHFDEDFFRTKKVIFLPC